MDSIKQYIYEQVSNHNLSQKDAKKFLLELQKENKMHDIAVIGIAGKFPMADNLDEYWKNIKEGSVCIREFPKERRANAEAYLKKFHKKELLDENRLKPDGSIEVEYEIRGYMDHIDKFDANFFGIPPREANAMDPNQRLFLETAYLAMEDGGYCAQSIYGKKVGVFVGIDHVEELKYKKLAANDPMVVTGTWPGILASRLSYIYDFKGPSMVIDTACSSGLVSVHEACKSLLNGECEMAMAGGLSSFYYKPTSFKGQMKELDSIESKDDKVRTFDNYANGTTWGEGIGVVMLKPFEQAQKDGDIIHAIIKASAINNDGASNGLTAPSVEAQEKLILDAWGEAKIDPATIQYIEAHGTGTVLGDPIEIKSMTKAFRQYTENKQFCGVGSVKPNIGHLVGASGIASLLKVILMMKNKSLVPSLNFQMPNRFINFMDSPIYINDQLKEWERLDTPRRAAVNSFGFSGTNCHVVLEEAQNTTYDSTLERPFYFYTVSAMKKELLLELVKTNVEYFKTNDVDLRSACYTSNVGRGHYGYRVVLLIKNKKDLIEKLEYILEHGLDELNKFDICYGYFKIISKNKVSRSDHEIIEGQKRKFSQLSVGKVQELIQSYDYPAAIELCNLYVKGADVNWKEVYGEKKPVKIRIPVYPLERTSYWYQIEEDNEEIPCVQSYKSKVSALIDQCLVESMKEDIYVTRFSPKTHWLLEDHVILGKHIIPGTTFVEMTLELCKRYFNAPVNIKEVVYYAPCIVDEECIKDVQSIVTKKKDHYEFLYVSRNEKSNLWEKHAECSAYLAEYQKEILDIEEIKRSLLQQRGEQYIDITPKQSAITLGERWQNETILAVGTHGILLKLELPEHMTSDLENSYLHVAMFDNAVNAISQKVGDGLYLPYFYKSIEFYNPMHTSFYSYIRLNTDQLNESKETITYNADLINLEGEVFGKVRNYSTKKVNADAALRIQSRDEFVKYYCFDWVREQEELLYDNPKKANLLLFYSVNEQGKRLQTELEDQCNCFIKVQISDYVAKVSDTEFVIRGEKEDFMFVMKELKDTSITHILYAPSYGDTLETKNVNHMEKNLNHGVYGMFHLIKALLQRRFSEDIKIAVIASRAYKVKEEETCIPENAALGALTKVIPLEYPNFKCLYLDTDEKTEISTLVQKVMLVDYQYNYVLRENRCYVEQFREADLIPDKSIAIKEQGVYVISGGTGGLGMEIAKYLASKQKVQIILMNRSVFPERSQWEEIKKKGTQTKHIRVITSIEKIEKHGSKVVLLSKNVTLEEEVRSGVEEIRRNYGSIQGIFHCAGLAGDSMMISKEFDKFKEVTATKIKGAYLLDQYTKEDNLDFMVLFSSILSAFGDVGQSDYMAANAYLDSFSSDRNTKGRYTRVINWPAWKEVGMAIDYGVVDKQNNFNSITTSTALNSMEVILNSSYDRVFPVGLNKKEMNKHLEHYKFKFSPEIQKQLESSKEELGSSTLGNKSKEKYEWNEEYTDTENQLFEIWSEVFGLDKIDIYDNFSALGGDSFLAIQLFKEINKVYEDVIEISDIYTYPSIQEMALYIDSIRKEVVIVDKTSIDERMDSHIEDIVKEIQSGDTSIEEAMKLLSVTD